jgi:glycerol-1-phosphate dehydrogenase [NAD(P)+]
MELPQVVLIGPDTISELSKELSWLGKFRAVIVTSQTPFSLFSEKISEILRKEKINFSFHVIDKKNDVNEEFEKISAKFSSGGFDVVLGFGGGKVIDVAKLIASHRGVLLVSIPTVLSHDGIASPLVSVPSNDRRYSIYAKTPNVIIADTSILSKAPHRHTVSGFADIIAKYTAVRDWRLAHLIKGEYYGDYAAKLAETSVEMVVRECEKVGKHKEEGVRVLAEALINCGIVISIVGNSRPCSGSEHLFSHSLDLVANYPALHGEQVGVGTIMMAYLHNADWKLIKDVLKTVGAPISYEGLRTSPEKIVEALTLAHKIRPERYTILGESGLTRLAAKSLAEETGVI